MIQPPITTEEMYEVLEPILESLRTNWEEIRKMCSIGDFCLIQLSNSSGEFVKEFRKLRLSGFLRDREKLYAFTKQITVNALILNVALQRASGVADVPIIDSFGKFRYTPDESSPFYFPLIAPVERKKFEDYLKSIGLEAFTETDETSEITPNILYTQDEVYEILRQVMFTGTPEFYDQGGICGNHNLPPGHTLKRAKEAFTKYYLK